MPWLESHRWCLICRKVTLHRKQPSPELPWDEWNPLVVIIHALRTALELVIEPRICVECEGWRNGVNDEPDQSTD